MFIPLIIMLDVSIANWNQFNGTNPWNWLGLYGYIWNFVASVTSLCIYPIVFRFSTQLGDLLKARECIMTFPLIQMECFVL